MADKKKQTLPDYIVKERVKAETKPYAGVVYEERIQAGSPESDDALRAASGVLPTGDEETPAEKSTSAKKK